MLSIYRAMVSYRRTAREPGLSPVALSRLTRSADDRRAWDEAYARALRIGIARDAESRTDTVLRRFNEARARVEASERHSVHVDRYAR